MMERRTLLPIALTALVGLSACDREAPTSTALTEETVSISPRLTASGKAPDTTQWVEVNLVAGDFKFTKVYPWSTPSITVPGVPKGRTYSFAVTGFDSAAGGSRSYRWHGTFVGSSDQIDAKSTRQIVDVNVKSPASPVLVSVLHGDTLTDGDTLGIGDSARFVAPGGTTVRWALNSTASLTDPVITGSFNPGQDAVISALASLTDSGLVLQSKPMRVSLIVLSAKDIQKPQGVTVDLEAGSYTGMKTVHFGSTTPGTTIWVSVDGAAFTNRESLVLADTATVRAYALNRKGTLSSDTASWTWNIDAPDAIPVVTVSDTISIHQDTFSVTLKSSIEGANIQFKIDGGAWIDYVPGSAILIGQAQQLLTVRTGLPGARWYSEVGYTYGVTNPHPELLWNSGLWDVGLWGK